MHPITFMLKMFRFKSSVPQAGGGHDERFALSRWNGRGAIRTDFSLWLVAGAISVGLMTGCGSGNSGELTGSLERPKWSQAVPYGTVLLKGGSLQVGQNEQDVFSSNYQTYKTI